LIEIFYPHLKSVNPLLDYRVGKANSTSD